MNIIDTAKIIITNPTKRINLLTRLGLTRCLSDEDFLRIKFKAEFGYELNLDDPQTFNEKLQWLKLYDRKPEYTIMVDKYAVKKYVADKIGEQYIIPTLGVWNSFDEIDFDRLPEQFVLKCTHDSGGIVIVRDKNEMDKKAAKKKLTKLLKRNYYWGNREWSYKDVPRKIIAEKFMCDKNSKSGLIDYRIYCFNGDPKFIYSYTNENNSRNEKPEPIYCDIFDCNWNPLEFHQKSKPCGKIKKPVNLDKILNLAKVLCENLAFIRVDFYEIDEKIYFGELTLFPGGGFSPFYPEEWDYKLGNLIELPEKRA